LIHPIQPHLDDIIAGNLPFSLDIPDEDGRTVGVLRPLTQTHLDDQEIIHKLTDWRNQNMENFLSHFVATPARTSNWMRHVLFKRPGQMLFLIYVNDQLVGHFGFKDLIRDEVLLDNAMRGESAGHPRLFVFAGKVLVQWLLCEAAVQRVYAYVMTDNVASVMMNRQIGFGGWIRHPLIKSIRDGETHWKIGTEGVTSPDSRYCFKFVIERFQGSQV